jgi:hypothetical protein
MKIVKGLSLLFISLVVISCFEPPEFGSTPHIDYVGVGFKEGSGAVNDSLIVTIEFEDGEGDLGIDGVSPQFKSFPYNNVTLYQANSNDPANLVPINTILTTVEHTNKKNERVTTSLNVLQIDDPTRGKLVFPRTRKQAGFGYLPAYHCEFYEDATRSSSYAIETRNKAVLDPKTVVDTLYVRINGTRTPTHYVIRDTLYFTRNPKHFNIEVDFLVKDPLNPESVDGFVEFDWSKEFCQQNLDGRFPILADPESARPLAGTIRYGMTSIGFKRIFTIKTLKLRIKIRDREFNESNVVMTQEFTLDSIRIP